MTEHFGKSNHINLHQNFIQTGLEGHFYSNRLRLKFVGGLEARYRRYCSRRDRRYILNLVSILVGFYIFYGFFDWYLLGDAAQPVWLIRYVIGLPVLLGVLGVIRSRRSEPYLNTIVVFGLTWLSVCTLYMAKLVPMEPKGMYMASELAMVVVGLNITRMRFWNCVFTAFIFIALLLLFIPPVGEHQRVLMYFLCLSMGSVSLCLLAQYGADRSSRREFLQKQIISKKNRELEKLNQSLKGLAEMDALSGIANRRHFDQVLDDEWRRARRRGYSLAVLMCDIDYFKAYNDELGHPQGDECIKRVAGCMKAIVRRPGDMVARYGGEEFSVILPALGLDEAAKIGEIICDSIRTMKISHPNSQVSDFVTISVGAAACIPGRELTKMELVGWADEALYDAKESGRNNVKCHAMPTS